MGQLGVGSFFQNTLNDFRVSMLLLRLVLESEDMFQEAEKVSGLPKHDDKGNNGSEKIKDN